MKKLSVLALLCLMTASAFAQRYEYGEPVPINEGKKSKRNRGGGDVALKQVRFGAFIAPNSGWMKPTANKSDDKLFIVDKGSSQMGFAWGLMMDYYFAENYGIATGFQLNRMGGNISITQNPAVTQPVAINQVRSADFTYKVQYLEVPFGLKLRSDDLGGIRVFGQIGISAGITLSKKATYDVVFTDTAAGTAIEKRATGENEKISGLGITPILLQMNVGGGIEYAITEKMSIYAALLFNNGFTPDATNPKELDLDFKGKFSDGNVRMNNIALRIGLFF
ncbi:MAG: PorT family protein [Flavipsychrobacter sp.]|nr:PorT family protein [Flavipsychrobacter sp.]